ncbi:efflux transporter outer membrane subunit [Piscinibacter sakaiensis]|uniref:Outer membrane component of tripartite multidrug resistance system n=1 Tax=Piscinibacter sakaiensis TaxID=1547922 RepID=A0A0K8NWL9_PISS1|nr:efflux transporter outer membrane subunit [Piscinibacter sakaiensis]GAP34669.1 outer membrane component of tripartite multidrug resistance system [Piscinibacter sakaiensis]
MTAFVRSSSRAAPAARRPAPLAALALAALLAGCAALPTGAPPPHALRTVPPAAAAADWPERNAWDRWDDPVLAGLIATAQARQPSLQQVRARLAQAAAAVDATRAAEGLQGSLAVDLTRQRFTENGLVPPPLAGSVAWNNGATLNLGWEWDLFGRQRAALAAALGQQRAAEAEAQAAAVLLSANVAAAYVALARAVEGRALTESALAQRRQVLALVRQRIAAGLDTTVELRQAEGVIAQTEVERAAADEQIQRSRHALAELTGQAPDALAGLAPTLQPVQAQSLPAGLPADLLGRRADLVAQRWRVEAALREVDVARAQFYPNVNLVAFAGLSSLGLDSLLKAGSLSAGLGPALRLPVFDGGRLRANLAGRRAEVDAAVEAYNATLLRALREVADEVASLQGIERQQEAQARALAAAESAFALATQRYEAGLGNFLIVLTAESNVLAQRRALVELKARHLGAEAALSRALGGGWRDDGSAARLAPTA